MKQRFRNTLDVYEAYRVGHLSLEEASSVMRHFRGARPVFFHDPWSWLGWWVSRLFFCPVGSHAFDTDHMMRVPGYSGPPEVCFVCRLIKVKPCP